MENLVNLPPISIDALASEDLEPANIFVVESAIVQFYSLRRLAFVS